MSRALKSEGNKPHNLFAYWSLMMVARLAAFNRICLKARTSLATIFNPELGCTAPSLCCVAAALKYIKLSDTIVVNI